MEVCKIVGETLGRLHISLDARGKESRKESINRRYTITHEICALMKGD